MSPLFTRGRQVLKVKRTDGRLTVSESVGTYSTMSSTSYRSVLYRMTKNSTDAPVSAPFQKRWTSRPNVST